VDPGNRKFTVRNTPRVISGTTPEWADLGHRFYSQFITAPITKVSNCRTAEAAKLLENIFRNVNIALVNELAMVFEKLNIDLWETIDAAATKPFGFMPFYPGPGVGGHCIPLDPFYFYYKAMDVDSTVWSIWLAEEINHRMPFHIINIVKTQIKKSDKRLTDSTIAIFGLAYKGEVSDVRESPALRIISILSEHQTKKIAVYDPYVKRVRVNDTEYVSEKDAYSAAKGADCIIIVTKHNAFKNLDFDKLRKEVKTPIIVDSLNALRGIKLNGWNYVLLGGARRGEK
jgi:UDP-N-acetyl-D-glucosamine dehydrogenase